MKPRRLPKDERRRGITQAAILAFADESYSRTTMAAIAVRAGVTPALLYRHFDAKSALFVHCLRTVWEPLHDAWIEVRSDRSRPHTWLMDMGRSFIDASPDTVQLGALWFQALAVGESEPEIADAVAAQMGEVHAFVRATMELSQTLGGGVSPARDADAESWIFVSTGLLLAAQRRLGGTRLDIDAGAVIASRREWLYGA